MANINDDRARDSPPTASRVDNTTTAHTPPDVMPPLEPVDAQCTNCDPLEEFRRAYSVSTSCNDRVLLVWTCKANRSAAHNERFTRNQHSEHPKKMEK